MTSANELPASTRLLVDLASPAVRALLLASIAGLALAVFRVKAASVRLFTWTAVLYAAMAMPFLGWMLSPVAIPTPAFFQRALLHSVEVAPVSAKVQGAQAFAGDSLSSMEAVARHNDSPKPGSLIVPTPSIVSPGARIQWNDIPSIGYLAVACLFLIRFFIGSAFASRLMHASRAIDDPHLIRKFAARGRSLGLSSLPRLAESEFISVPVTLGALRPMILLPVEWREWDDAKLDAIAAHEMSHVARRDTFTQRLSLLYSAIFWFSPLAWWLAGHLADLAEQASDEAALSCGIDRQDYARTLLGFFAALQAAPGRVWWQGVSMAKSGQSEKRVERVLCWRGAMVMNVKRSIVVAVIALAIPVVYLAASARPANNRGLPDAHLAQVQPSGETAPAADTQPQVSAVSSSSEAAPAAVAPEPTAQSAPTVADAQDASAASAALPSDHGYSYSYGYNDDERFVLVTGDSDTLTMSGSTGDARHVEKLRKSIPGDFIWFQSDEKSYIIRDQATVNRARKLWAPQEELGRKQEELGKQQEVLGKQQEEIGTKMEQVHVTVPDMTAELDKLKAELKQLNSSATVEQVGQIQSEIGELQSRIGKIQSRAGEQQSKLGEQQGALGEKQGKLGEQQGELGRQQAELAKKANREMKQLLDEAIAKGIAQPEL
jgi:beta-lactamase regulating signal transducer with metallopeptidase domain